MTNEKHRAAGNSNGGSTVIYEGDWTTAVPWPMVIAGKALSHGAQRVWIALRYHARRPDEEPTCFPGRERLADFMGISTAQLSKYIRELKKIDLVSIRREPRVHGLGVINVYTLHDPLKWWRKTGKKLKQSRS